MNKEKTPESADSRPDAAQRFAEGIISTTGKGLGFVALSPEAPREENIRIETGSLNTALPGDKVKVVLHSRIPNMQQTGEVIEVLERARTRFVGTIDQNGLPAQAGGTYLVPQDTRIYVDFLIPEPPKEDLNKKKVLVELLEWTDPKKNPTAKVIEVIGPAGENETEIRAIVLEKGLALELPEKIEEEAHALKAAAPAFIAEEAKKRRDFRGITTFTIDPADAKDFDDAISIQTLPSGFIEIGVHIADVSAYVKPHAAIDEEARARATSIYLVDRVIPMFPEVLSNDLCSLNQGEDKLVFSAVFTFAPEAWSDPKAKAVVKDSWFGRAIIHSDKRFTYEEAQGILDAGTGLYHDELLTLNTIAKKLAKQGREEGAISFEHEEVRFVLDENKRPIRVYKKVMQDTNKLVEQYMLLANKKVAEYVSEILGEKEKGPHAAHESDLFVYRVHDAPDPERLEDLRRFLASVGYQLPIHEGRVSPHDLNALLDKIKGKPEEMMLSTATIRTMAKAIYSTSNIGHYGLAFEHYTHFTSPIRRYPDVMVHRLLAHYLNHEPVTEAEMQEYRSLSAHSSEMEKLAADAERASIKFKQAEYMSERIGKVFTGVISGVAEWGIFVEEEETKCEGLVRIADLGDDYYIFEKENYRIIGKNTRKRYRLGDKVRIRVKAVDLERKSIDYELVEEKK